MCDKRQCLQEPPGKLPRLNATVQEPLGEHDPEHSPLCGAFRQPGVAKVAIIGNGPLDDAQRKEIDTFDVVVRCSVCPCIRPREPSVITQ